MDGRQRRPARGLIEDRYNTDTVKLKNRWQVTEIKVSQRIIIHGLSQTGQLEDR